MTRTHPLWAQFDELYEEDELAGLPEACAFAVQLRFNRRGQIAALIETTRVFSRGFERPLHLLRLPSAFEQNFRLIFDLLCQPALGAADGLQFIGKSFSCRLACRHDSRRDMRQAALRSLLR